MENTTPAINARALLLWALSLATGALFAAAPEKSVISINMCQGRNADWVTDNGVKEEGALIGHIDTEGSGIYPTLVGDVPAAAWCCLDSQNGGSARADVTTAWDGIDQEVVSGQPVSISLSHAQVNNYAYDTKGAPSNVYTPEYMRMFVAQRNGTTKDVTMTVSSIPYAQYTVVLYCAGMSGTSTHTPIKVGELYYSWDSSGLVSATTANQLSNWGDLSYSTEGFELGKNVLRIEGVTGSTLTIFYSAAKAGVAALQIVDESMYDYDTEDEDGDRPASDVISLNMCQSASYPGHIGENHAPLYTLAGWLPADAWRDFDKSAGAQSSQTIECMWDAAGEAVAEVQGIAVSFSGYVPNMGYDNNFTLDNIYAPDYLRTWLSKKDGTDSDTTLAFAGVPFMRYSAIIYMSGVQNAARTSTSEGRAFYPVKVNDSVWYSWDATAGKTVPVRSDWGDCTYARAHYDEGQAACVAYGQNAIRVDNLVGSQFSLYNLGYSGGIAAVQIVEDASAGLDAEDLIPVVLAAGDNVPVSGAASVVTAPNAAAGIVKSGAGTLTVSTALGYRVKLDSGTLRLMAGVGVGGAVEAAAGTVIECMERPDWDGVMPVFQLTGSPTVKIIGTDGAERAYAVRDGNYVFTPSTTGTACIYDFGFEGTLANAGSAGGAMERMTDGSDAFAANEAEPYFNGTALCTGVHPGSGNCHQGYPTDGGWTAVVKGKLPGYGRAVFVSFGNLATGSLSLATGENLDSVMLVRTTGDSAYTKLAEVHLPTALSAEHLFVLTAHDTTNVTLRVDDRGVTSAAVVLPAEHPLAGFGDGGIRVGSLRQGVGDTGLVEYSGYGQVASGSERRSYVEALRLYDFVLGPNALSAVAAELGVYKPGFLVYFR